MSLINEIKDVVNSHQSEAIMLNDEIWKYAELRFHENKSAELLSGVLEKEGFDVGKGLAGIGTAFRATYGTGKPVIGILGEFDALSGLSQQAGVCTEEPLVEGGSGHGCGHNSLGAASLTAAVAVKDYLLKHGSEGTIIFFGCPGEEGGSGKTFMARAGVFDSLDAALTWHPGTHNAVFNAETLANYQVYFKYFGKSSHASASPYLGRSALDAVELMNVGVNYLREHMIPQARIHYAVTDTGGKSPNVVQAEAEVLYLIRAPQVKQVDELYSRVCNIARGAALMTGTRLKISFDKACSNFIPNRTLGKLLEQEFCRIGAPPFTEEDYVFARKMRETFSEDDIGDSLDLARRMMGSRAKDLFGSYRDKILSDTIIPMDYKPFKLFGSTDVGDVSRIVPTAQIYAACYAIGTPGHSWQIVSQGTTPMAHKGMLTAAKVLAAAALALLQDRTITEEAKKELSESLDGATYVCPIPENVEPHI